MSEKPLFPSTARLQKLRESGIVPYSKAATRVLMVAVIVAIVLSRGGGFSAWLLEQEWYGSHPGNPPYAHLDAAEFGEKFARILSAGVEYSLILVMVCFFAGPLVIGLLQNRFLFHASFVSPSARRLWKRPAGSHSSLLEIVFWLACAMGGVMLGVRFLMPEIIAIFAYGSHGDLTQRGASLGSVGIWLILTALVFAVLAVVGARAQFLYRHRMSREEHLAEARENGE